MYISMHCSTGYYLLYAWVKPDKILLTTLTFQLLQSHPPNTQPFLFSFIFSFFLLSLASQRSFSFQYIFLLQCLIHTFYHLTIKTALPTCGRQKRDSSSLSSVCCSSSPHYYLHLRSVETAFTTANSFLTTLEAKGLLTLIIPNLSQLKGNIFIKWKNC